MDTATELGAASSTSTTGAPAATSDVETVVVRDAGVSPSSSETDAQASTSPTSDTITDSAPSTDDDSGPESSEQSSQVGTSADAAVSGDETEPTGTDESTSEPPVPTDCESSSDEQVVVGYGKNTTGGGSASTVTVSTFAEATEALESYRDAFEQGTQSALVLRYTGTFDFGTITDVCAQHTKQAQILQIKETENVTLEGAPGSSANFGIKINRAKNVIIRNMTIGLLPGGGDSDAITIEGNGNNGDVENVWIDHNDLFSSTKDDCEGAGDTEFDGLIDIKKGARFITISFNRLHDHQKTGLLGSSDTDEMDRFVTFHHNWYENVVSRTPLHRFGYVHLFNNYFNRILDSGINVRMGGVALIEANYFSNAANPVTSRYSDELGFWDLRDNHVGENVTWSETEDTLANADDWTSTITFPAEQLSYEYATDDAECVKAIVMAGAGATLTGE